jgi:hypothetical protein
VSSLARRRSLSMLRFAALAWAACFASRGKPVLAADPRVGFREPVNVLGDLTVGDRIDAQGNNSSRARLPRSPEVSFQTRLAPPIVGQPVADGGGGFVVAHGRDRVSALDATGHTLWSARLGVELASGPIPIGGHKHLLVTRDGRLFELSRAGVVLERERLGWSGIDGSVLSAPTADGGAVVATSTRLARVAPAGARGYETKLGVSVRAVFDWRGATLAIGSDGSIWIREAAGDPRELANFGVPVAEAMLVGDRLLGLAQHELVSVDLRSRKRSVTWSDPTLELHDVATSHGGHTTLVAGRATLVELDAGGHELARVTLPSGEGGAELSSVIVDAAGALLVGANSSPLWTVTPEGDASSVPGTGCPDPLRPTPVAEGKVVAACRSGLVRGLSDRAR